MTAIWAMKLSGSKRDKDDRRRFVGGSKRSVERYQVGGIRVGKARVSDTW
jgi:hypothetical protein